MRMMTRIVLLLYGVVLVGGCTLGPDYRRPPMTLPAAYAENADWQPARPADHLPRGAWWTIFGDAMLNELEAELDAANPSLRQAEAQYRQAEATLAAARANLWPTLSAALSASRSGRGAAGVSGSTSSTAGALSSPVRPIDSYRFDLTAAWEPDWWGRVRRTIEAETANAEASAALLEVTRLSLHASLAQAYFQLRIVDEQRRLLDDTVAAYRKSRALTENQYRVGVAARSDVVLADAQLKTAQVQAIDLGIGRAALEHAIATLIGKPPAEFHLEPRPLSITPPTIPVGVPSQLLERRPDIAEAERQVAAANAEIGVAESAFFPNLTLSASGGFETTRFATWLTAPSRVWSLGPALAETLFDAGARRAATAQARAAYEAAVANYRSVVLAALQNVEDELAALRILEQEAAAQAEAVAAAEESLRIVTNQYRAGTVDYLRVINAQTTAYANERNAIALLGSRLNDSIALIKALGGGWASDTPAVDDERSRAPDSLGEMRFE